jgi:hypothetical protein
MCVCGYIVFVWEYYIEFFGYTVLYCICVRILFEYIVFVLYLCTYIVFM